jgi:cytochrome b-561
VSDLRTPLRDFSPSTPREASEAIVRNFLLHAFPVRTTKRALAWITTGWLGTLTLALFLILCATGGFLLFVYVPSVESAYASILDLEHMVRFGSWLRGTHRAAAHLMVIAVVLHLARVFLTGAYKREGLPGATRPLNWLVGIVLLVLTLGLSFTGYLLPWDQLAFWAVTVGTRIAASVPFAGAGLRDLLLGGEAVGPAALTRFYALHCFLLPALTIALTAYHLWRIRKDGGLAASDRVADAAMARAQASPPSPGKTYTLLGTTRAEGVGSVSAAPLLTAESVMALPNLVRRVGVASLIALALSSAIGFASAAPLEPPADPARTPNPAKAPWYFLWLQELVSDLTFRIGGFAVDGALVGGVLLPGLLVGLLAAWPFLDKSPREAAGVWFHPSRRRQTTVFLGLLAAIAVLTLVGSLCRGPYWAWVWPWEARPPAPTWL